jgi:hypothetical protein
MRGACFAIFDKVWVTNIVAGTEETEIVCCVDGFREEENES